MATHPLDALIGRLRSDELTLDEFADAAAESYIVSEIPPYPEEPDGADLLGVSHVTIRHAVRTGKLTRDEADAIYQRRDA